MRIFQLDLSKKNAAISIIFTLDIVFFIVAIALSLGIRSTTRQLGDKVWAVFMGTQMALMVVLNSEAKKELGIPDDTTDAKVEQSTSVTQETKVTTPDPEKAP